MSHKQHVNFQGSTLIFLFCFLSTHECITSEETFDVDTKNLTNVFRKLQSHLHPDKFSLKSEVSLCMHIKSPRLPLVFSQAMETQQPFSIS